MDKRGDSGENRELKLLEALAEEPEIRQVDLAARLGIAVGTVNWLLKRLAAKGYIKVQRIGQWRWRYLLTPQGIAEKARLTQRYLQDSMHLYRQTRQEARRLLNELRKRGYTQVRLEGDPGNDLVDVCRLTCLEQGVKVVGSGGSDLPPTTHHSSLTTSHWPQAIHHGPRTTNHDNVPLLRVDGRKLSLEWPEEKT